MKILRKSIGFSLIALVLSGCYMPWEKDTDEQHLRSYEPITGKFVLHDNLDKRYGYTDTYFIFDGTKGAMTVNLNQKQE